MTKKKISKILEEIKRGIHEKDEIMSLSLLSALSEQSIFFIGPPGVAKSLIARRVKSAFKDCESFEYLMNRFSTPDEIFGPISIESLKVGEYKRLTKGYLPSADIVFLDEIWKAGPSIQNTLLTVLNERIFKNGTIDEHINLKLLISASNELPAKDQGLEALWDRFIIRCKVDCIKDDQTFNSMVCEGNENKVPNLSEAEKISAEEYKSYVSKISKIEIPEEILKVIKHIRVSLMKNAEKNQTNNYISDRRWKKIVALLRTSALLNERKKVDLMDCFIIRHCIWNEVEQIEFANSIVIHAVKEFGYTPNLEFSLYESQIEEYKNEVEKEIYVDVENGEEDEDGNPILTKKLSEKPLSRHNSKGFDDQAELIQKRLNNEINSLENYVKKDLKDIKTNLFVPAEYAQYVEENINNLKQRIRQLLLNIDNIKDSYEELK